MMEIQIKKAVKAGNSSAVILPRAWLNKEVRIELIKKTPETILIDVIEILRRYIELKDIIGIYLTGSYARKEENEKSDIDILVITDNIDKEMIQQGIYNILLVSWQLLKQKLEQDLFPIGAMINEAKPLLNSSYLSTINIKVTRKNIDWYLKTTEDKLNLIEKAIKNAKNRNQGHVSDNIAYTLILRIRTLYLTESLVKKKPYSKQAFIKLIERISKSRNAYESYLAAKNNLEDKKMTSISEAEKLYSYLKNQLIKVKSMVN